MTEVTIRVTTTPPATIEVQADPSASVAEAVAAAAEAEASATAAAASETAAAASAVASAASAAAANLDAADAAISATAADASATAADGSATAAAASAAAADADATATAADRVQTGLDAVATAADRVQTGLDVTATGADAVATAADRVQTGLDVIAAEAAAEGTEDFAIDAAASAAAAEAAAASSTLAAPNLLVNGRGVINQRNYTSGAATSGANQATLDMWRVVVSGQNLSWTGPTGRKVMTAPAGGVEQRIYGANIIGGSYTISWFGTATCTVNGVARTNGETFTIAADTFTTVRFTGGTFTDAKLEEGVVATAYPSETVPEILVACEPYYEVGVFYSVGYQVGGNGMAYGVGFRCAKAIVPTISFAGISYTNASGLAADLIGTRGFRGIFLVTATGSGVASASWAADATP